MIDETELVTKLEARIKEITDTMTDDMQPLVKLLQSTRARVLMDMVDCVKAVQKTSCPTAEELKKKAAANSWQGHVDRQGGQFEDWEHRNPSNWR